MANMSEEWRQSIINEISKELATKAFATRARDAFEMDDIKQHDKADKTKERIVKKHGKKAGDEAEKAAERAIYGHNKYSEAQEREEEKKKSMKKEEVEKWIQKAIKHPGALHKQLGVPEGEKIPAGKLEAAAEKGGKLGKRARLAQTLKGLKKEEVEMVDEAQRARENPEDHDKEEKRKYEPVRGERTPMPPRGDKRREDFEKWYAKHVR
jgi:hypothetical protein